MAASADIRFWTTEEQPDRLAKQQQIDGAFIDVQMPGMSGLEVLQAIRTRQPELPVVLITGYAAIDNAVEAMKNGG